MSPGCAAALAASIAASSEPVETTSGTTPGELFDQLGVVRAHADERMYLRTGESLQRFVVVAFVRAPAIHTTGRVMLSSA